jgi:hypothetical protein
VRKLLKAGSRLILGLPPAVAGSTAVQALFQGLGDAFTIDSVVLACAPDAVEDQIWDHHTLFESGFTPVPEDDRTPGEFLMGELLFSDSVLLADPALVPVDPAARARGIQLIKELAPHAVVAESAGDVRPGRHNLAEATARTVPGSVRIPAESFSPFTTVVQRIERPLHPGRFRQALAEHPDAVFDWHPEFGDRGTVLAVTGDDVDAAEVAALLTGCELTDAEMASSPGTVNDPYDLNRTTETTQRSNS